MQLSERLANETRMYFDAYATEMNKLVERREAVRAASKDPDAFDARFAKSLVSFMDATSCLESFDFVYFEALISTVKKFLDSEQPS